MTNEQQQHWIKPGIRGLPAADPFRVEAQRHRLQWNENPYEFPADLKEIVLEKDENAFVTINAVHEKCTCDASGHENRLLE